MALALGAVGLVPMASGAAETEATARVIVVMDDQPAASRVAGQRDMLAAAADAGVEAEVRYEFTDLIDAVAVTVAEADVARLADLPGVADVVPDQRIHTSTDVSVPLVGAPDVWEQEAPGGGPGDGTGTVVAVLDTGIDYTNPSLGGAFGPGNKVVAGHDFVNADADPMDDNGHGTHVAGIIAGSGEVTGVAPGAQLTAYKVVDSRGSGWETDIIAGLVAATDPDNPYRADVVNLSLGGPGDGTDPLGKAATAATEAGVVVVASAGNSGPGAHTVGSPAAADGVLAVGASTSGLVLPTARITAPRNELLQAFRAPYSAPAPAEPVTGELVDVGEGTEEDYDRVGDVTGKVVAYKAELPPDLSRVWAFMLDDARLAEERGAIALVAYSGIGGGPVLAPGETTVAGDTGVVDVPLRTARSGDSFRMDDIVVLGLRDLQWEQLQRDLADGPVEIEISGEDVTDRVASFSSRGPTEDFKLKPDLVAPGVEIRSTWPTESWEPGVYRLSGTSMAAPHVAGAAALLRQLQPDESVDEIGGRLVGSATPLDGVGPATSGTGRLDVAAAAAAQLVASPASVSLGLADLAEPVVGASGATTLRNTADTDVAVTLGIEQAAGSVGTANVSPSEAVIPAGGTLDVQVNVSADQPDQDADLSGWVVADVAGDDVPGLRVAYQLSVQHLVVQASPDPSDGASSAFVWSPVELSEPPTLTVTPPRGRPYTVTTRHDHDDWYRIELSGEHVGAYSIAAAATTTTGVHLAGAGAFEVAANVGNSNSPARWQPIGPNADAGPIATTPADSDVAAITQSLRAAPWTTDDGGETWRQHTRLPIAAGTGADNLVISATDPDTMWYAVSGSISGSFGATLDPSYQGRILRTRDGGETWQTLDVPDVEIISLHGDEQTQVLVAVTADSLLVSRDGGDTWSAYKNEAGSDLTRTAVGGDDLFLTSARGVWAVRGVMAGEPQTTERVYEADAYLRGLIASDSLVAVLDNNVVVGSSDGGETWGDLYEVPGGSATFLSMTGDVILVSTNGDAQHLSRDHGATWTSVPQLVPGAPEEDIAPWGDGLLWSSAGAGLFRTEDDGTDPVRIGIQGMTAHDLAIAEDPAGTPRLLAGTNSDVYRTDLPTRPKLPADVAEWGLSGSEAGVGTQIGQVAVSPQDPQTVWKVNRNAQSLFWVDRSTDGGQEWERLGQSFEDPMDIAVAPADPDRVVVPFWSLDGVGLYLTDDDGETWGKHFHDEMFTTVAADPDDPDKLWLGSASGLYRSDDFGETVEKVADGPVTSVAVSDSQIVAAGSVIQVSDDGGKTFTTADSGGLPMRVSDLLVSPADPDTWYAAAGSFIANGLIKGGRGVLRSNDGGQTWVNVSSGLQNLSVVSLEISPDGRWLYAGTEDGGVHRARAR